MDAHEGEREETPAPTQPTGVAADVEEEVRAFQTHRIVAFQRLTALSLMTGRLETPTKHFESKLRQKEDLETLECLGELYAAANDLAKCEAVCERILQLRPGHVEAREFLAAKCADMGNRAKAIVQCRELVRRNPGWEAGYLTKLVDLCLDAGQVESAMALVNEQIGRGLADPELVCELGIRLLLKGQDVHAGRVFGSIKPTLANLPLLMRAADAYVWAGKPDDATQVLWNYLKATKRGIGMPKEEGADDPLRPLLPTDSGGPRPDRGRSRVWVERALADMQTLNVAPFVSNPPGLWAVTSRYDGERLSALLKLAAIYDARGKLDDLVRELDAQARAPVDKLDSVIAGAYVRAYDGDIRGAVDILAERLVRLPEEYDVRTLYLYLIQKAESPKRLAEIYASVPSALIPRRYVHQALLTCHVNAGDREQAREAAELVASGGFTAQELMSLALDIARSGDVDVALQLVGKLQDLGAEDRDTALAFADVLVGKG
ncbi:MAG: hypothetical protein FJ278_20460, partial [Planctomycetes bacterium]|nr:hypothetical protein [Planctomycetota bacterium]